MDWEAGGWWEDGAGTLCRVGGCFWVPLLTATAVTTLAPALGTGACGHRAQGLDARPERYREPQRVCRCSSTPALGLPRSLPLLPVVPVCWG